VVEPVHVRGAALVSLGVDARLVAGVEADDRSPLPRRHLLVRVEREHRAVPARADQRAVLVARADRLARILNDPQPARPCELLESGHVGGPAEDVHRQDPGGPLGHGGRGRFGRDVQRARVDVDEHRRRILVKQTVGRRDEAQRRGDDLVARLDAGGANRQVESGGSARHR
jgi:hypothetical protein